MMRRSPRVCHGCHPWRGVHHITSRPPTPDKKKQMEHVPIQKTCRGTQLLRLRLTTSAKCAFEAPWPASLWRKVKPTSTESLRASSVLGDRKALDGGRENQDAEGKTR